MFSPKAFIQDIITRNLSEWVENLPDDSFQFGLLEGDLQLSNLAVKKQTWPLNQSLSLSLEYGTIDKFNVQVPWLQLHTGHVNLLLDTVVLVFRLNVLDHDKDANKASESFTQELKLSLLEKEELRMANDDGYNKKQAPSGNSWYSRTFNSLIGSIIAKIASNFTLTATNLKVSLLLPLPAQENALLKLNLRSLVISSGQTSLDGGKSGDNTNKKSLYEYFLSKDIQVRGLSLSLNRIAKPSGAKELVLLAKNKSHDTMGVMLNPCHISSQVFGRKDKLSDMNLQNLRTLAVQTSISNMEWTPSCDHLFLIKDITAFLEQEDIKYRYQAIRALLMKKAPQQSVPAPHPVSSETPRRSSIISTGKKRRSSSKRAEQKTAFNPREVWLYAIRAVLVIVKEKRSGSQFQPQLRSGMERLGLRRQYLNLYRKVLAAKLTGKTVSGAVSARLDHTNSTESGSATPIISTQDGNTVGLTVDESLKFAELHSIFSLSDLILFRATVLQEYRNKGVSGEDLRSALTNVKAFPLWSRWFSSSSSNSSRLHGSSTAQSSALDSTSEEVGNADDSQGFTFDVKFTLSRISVSIFDNPLDPHHPNNRRHASEASHLNFSTPSSHSSAPAVSVRNGNAPWSADPKLGTRHGIAAPNRAVAATTNKRHSRRGTVMSNSRMENSRVNTPVGNAQSRATATSAVNVGGAAIVDALTLPKQCFSIVVYGVHSSMEWAGDLDQVISITLGSLRAFGHRGTEIVACGGDPDYWLEYDFTKAQLPKQAEKAPFSEDRCRALNFSLRWCQTVVLSAYELSVIKKQQKEERKQNRRRRAMSGELMEEDEFGSDFEESDSTESEDSDEAERSSLGSGVPGSNRTRDLQIAADKYSAFDGERNFSLSAVNSAYRNLMRASNKHLVIEIEASYLLLNWHRKSILFLTDLYVHMMPTAGRSINGNLFHSHKMQCAELSYFRAARGIVDIPAKVSIEAKSSGIMLRIPIHSDHPEVHRGQANGRRSSRSRSLSGAERLAHHLPFERFHSLSDPIEEFHKSGIEAQYVQLSIGNLSLNAGDYLACLLTEQMKVPSMKISEPTTLEESVSEGKFAVEGSLGEESPSSPASGRHHGNNSSNNSSNNNSNSNFVECAAAREEHNTVSRKRNLSTRASRRIQSRQFLPGQQSSGSTYHDQNLEEPVPARPITPAEKVRELVLALKNEIVRPMAFSVTGIELCIVNATPINKSPPPEQRENYNFSMHKFFNPVSDSNAEGRQRTEQKSGHHEKEATKQYRMLTAVPWVIHGVISPNVVPSNISFTQLRLDLICNPFQLVLSTEDILKLIDMTKGMSAVISPVVSDAIVGPIAPRIRRLAPISCSFVDVEIEQFGVEFLIDTEEAFKSTSSTIATALTHYGAIIHKRGRHSFVALARRSVVLQQLCSLGVLDSVAGPMLLRFENDIAESRQSVQHIADTHTLGLFTMPPPRSAGSTKDDQNNSSFMSSIPDACRAILFNLQISCVRLLRHGLMFDSRTILTMRTLSLFDNDRVALLSISRELGDRLEHFPHLEKEDTAAEDELRGKKADLRSHSPVYRGNHKRKDSYGVPQRRDSTSSVSSHYAPAERDRTQNSNRRESGSRSRSKRHFPNRESPPDKNYSQTFSADCTNCIPPANLSPSYAECFRVDRHAADNCLTLQYDEQDSNMNLGEGGWGVDHLYMSMDSSQYGVRQGSVGLRGCQIDVQISTVSIIQIVDQAVKAVATVSRHFADAKSSVEEEDFTDATRSSSRRSSTGNSTVGGARSGPRFSVFARERRRRNSSIALMGLYREKPVALMTIYVHEYQRKISIKGELGAVTATMSSDQNYLAKLSLYRIAASVQDVTNFDGGRTCTVSVHSISLLDFTDLGAIHSEVLWKRNDNLSLHAIMDAIKTLEKERLNALSQGASDEYLYREARRRQAELFDQEKKRIKDAPPVIVFSLTQSETVSQGKKFQKTFLNVELDALRVSFLFRFLTEFVTFTSDKLAKPLQSMFDAIEEEKHHRSVIPAPLKVFHERGNSTDSQDSDISRNDSDYRFSTDSGSSESDVFLDVGYDSYSEEDQGPSYTAVEHMGFVPQKVSQDESPPMEVVSTFECTVNVTDFTCMIPRNSNSRDLVGLTVERGSVTLGYVADPFPFPEKDENFPGLESGESDRYHPLHLDVITNSWRYKASSETEKARWRATTQSELDACNLRSVGSPNTSFRQQRATTFSGNVASAGEPYEEGGDIFYDSNVYRDEWTANFDDSSFKDWGDASSIGKGWRQSMSGFDPDASAWWLQDDEDERQRLFLLQELANTAVSDDVQPKSCFRIAISLSQAHIYTTFSGPSSYHNTGSSSSHAAETRGATPVTPRQRAFSEAPVFTSQNQGSNNLVVETSEHKVFVEIQNGGLVNKFRRKAVGNVGVWPINLAWKELTIDPFNMLIVYDSTETKAQMLIGDTAEMATLRLKASQSELYLLIGVWFDNVFEKPQFGQAFVPPSSRDSGSCEDDQNVHTFTPEDREVHNRGHRTKESVRFTLQKPDSPRSSETPEYPPDRPNSQSRKSGGDGTPAGSVHQRYEVPKQHFARYGTKEYLRYLLERFTTFEILVVRAEIQLVSSLDTHYFDAKIPNHEALTKLEATGPGNAYCQHINAHHHHHGVGGRTPHGVGASGGKLPRGFTAQDDSGNLSSKSMHGSSEEKLNFSFYNFSADVLTPSTSRKVLYSRWVNKLISLADVRISGLNVHIRCDHDVTQLSMGAGKCEIYDMRHPKQTCVPLALRIAPGDDPTTIDHIQLNHIGEHVISNKRRVYGYSDFAFGFELLPSDMYVPPDLPLKVSFVLSEETNWMTCNVGLDLLDLNIHNLDLINLISDYFSCYFRFPEFGHPGVQAYDRLTAPYIIPYGGVDTRIFAFRPQISLLKSAMSSQSPALLLETEGGVYFRYTLDTDSTVKMELNIFSLSVVLVKRHRPPSQYRGIRGSSGSGKGVRTLIEYLNLVLSYHFVVATNVLDLKVLLSGPEEDDDEEESVINEADESMAVNNVSMRKDPLSEYVNLHGEQLHLGSSAIPYPHSVYPLVPARTDFTPHSCDIVTSYEDLTFCISLVSKLLGISESSQNSVVEHSTDKLDSFAAGQSQRPRSRSGDSVAESVLSDASEVATNPEYALFSVFIIAGVRLMVVDNVLGLHLPLVQIFVEEVQNTFIRDDHANMILSCAARDADPGGLGTYFPDLASSRQTRRFSREVLRRSSGTEINRRDSLAQELVRLKSIAQYQHGVTGAPNVFVTAGVANNAYASQDMMTFGKITVWAEYFNNMRKCWEPLLEKMVATVLYEKSILRGTGLTIRTASAIHVNVSGAFFRTLNDILTTLRSHNGDDSKEGGDESGDAKEGSLVNAGKRKTKRGSIHTSAYSEHDYQYDDHHQEMSSGRMTSLDSTTSKSKSDRFSLENNRQLSQRRKSRRSDSSFNRRSSINHEGDDGSSVATSATVNRKLDHVPSNPLSLNFRVGFSIQNLTGQPVRYLQQWEGGRRTVQYINNNERGLLNFVASKTLIRNNQVIEETFDVQMERNSDGFGSRNRRKAVGNRVALQVSGYRWLHAVQADELGVHYEELYSVLGRLHVSQVYKNWKIVNSLKLMVEVMPFCGGRMLRLRSVFTIKNNTRHKLKILAKEGASAQIGAYGESQKGVEEDDVPFLLDSGENFYVPLALLRRSVIASAGKSLGYLYLCPADLEPIEEELVSRPNSHPGSVEYTTDPINLYQTVVKSSEAAEAEEAEARRMAADSDVDMYYKSVNSYAKENYTQLVCHINPKVKSRYNNTRKSGAGGAEWQNNVDYHRQQEERRAATRAALNKLPPFCYCVEVQSGSDFSSNQKSASQSGAGSISSRFFSNANRAASQLNSPVNFTITIHPPIVLENLLPCGGIFELVHATQKRVLWSAYIAAGTVKPVHTVTLEEPLLLLINLKYCRSSEGALIHQPRRFESTEGIVGKMQAALEGLLEDNVGIGGETSEDVASIILTDTVGQRIRVNVDNTLGGGGQRQIAVFCPYWIVNTSHYSLRITEEGSSVLPAGSVTAQKDGTRPVPHSGLAFMEMQANASANDERMNTIDGLLGQSSTLANSSGLLSPNASALDSFYSNQKKGTRGPTISDSHPVGSAVFPGCYGPLHSVNNKEFAIDSVLGHQLQELSFNEIVDLSYMFNYIEPQGRLGKKRVKVQLDDTSWSRPFSLDSVGVNQMLTINNSVRGCMELGFKISVAPGRLAKYTKIVRFLPRFSIVNKLPLNLKILQPTGFAGEAVDVDVSAEKVRPYHLPAMFGERQIALQLEGGWHRSVAFNIDQIGVFTMQVKRRVNLATVKHVQTRGAPEYSEVFPPMRTLGLYFETDWGEENIVVKGFQKGSYAAKNTDIKVGDVLLSIDGEVVDGKKFELAMVLMRNKLSRAPGCTVRFRTVEEKIRLIRESAVSTTTRNPRSKKHRPGGNTGALSGGSSHGLNTSLHGESEYGDDLNLEPSPGMDLSGFSYDLRDPAGVTASGGRATNLRFDFDSGLGSQGGTEESIQSGIGFSEYELRERAKSKNNDRMVLRVELRQVESSAMVFVQELSAHVSAEYRIENKSACYKLYYKQKGITGNTWLILNPGQSCSYVWEDPFKPHKLLVHSGENVLSPTDDRAHIASSHAGQFLKKKDGDDMVSTYWGYIAGLNTDQATVVSFDEIGCKETVFLGSKTEMNMLATVKSEGPTKILLITPSLDNRHNIRELRYCSEFINEQLTLLHQLSESLNALTEYSSNPAVLSSKLALLESQFEETLVRMQEKQYKLMEVDQALTSGSKAATSASGPRGSFSAAKQAAEEAAIAESGHTNTISTAGLTSFRLIERVMDLSIDKPHQLVVHVLEAKDLCALVAGKMEDVYCKVRLKAEDLAVMTQRKYTKTFCTYICDSTLDPIWIEQRFVFDVPEKAVAEQRKYNIRLIVKSRSIVGLDDVLGQTDIELSCLKDERVLEGWFPLRSVRTSSVVSNMSGSIKLRLQWVHSPAGFANYLYSALDERQQYLKLQYNVQRFSLKHLQKIESNKSLSAKNDKDQQMQLRQAEKDYYELFEALAERERAQCPTATSPFLTNFAMPATGGESPERASEKTISTPFVRTPHFADEHKSNIEEEKALDTLLGRRRQTRAMEALNAPSFKVANGNVLLTPIVTKSEPTLPQSTLTDEPSSPSTRPRTQSINKRSLRGSTTPISATPGARSSRLARRGLSAKFDEEGDAQNSVLKSIPPVLHSHDELYHSWSQRSLNNIPVHQSMYEMMVRAKEVVIDHHAFCRRFEQECRRSFEHVHTLSGVLEVTPMQALHLPETKNPMLVRVAYGETRYSTFRLPPASYLTWYQDHDPASIGAAALHNPEYSEGIGQNNHGSFHGNSMDSSQHLPPQRDNSQNASLAKCFNVDTLNIKGALNVSVMTEGLTKAKEVAKIEIPMFNLLDCCFALTEGQYYDRWFPLILSSEAHPIEGDVDRNMNNILPEQSAHSSFDYQPCIRLRVRWIHGENRRQIEESRLYARIQIPSISCGLIDSNFAREVMQISIRGVELRRSVAVDFTDTSLNITSMQVDNQLPDPVSPVILCSTRVKHPQPVVRMHIRKKNLLSQGNLSSFETIQLIVQELDLHLEQQTVVASWELVKSLMQERKHSKQQKQNKKQHHHHGHNAMQISQHDNRNTVDGATTSMDTLGFTSCNAMVQYELLPTLEGAFRKKTSNSNKVDRSAGADGHGRDGKKQKSEDEAKTLYIEHFEIFPIKLNVSFITTPQILVAHQHKKQRESDIRSEGTVGLYSSVSLFLWQVGEVVLDLTSTISDAPIFFAGYEESHVFKTDHEIAKFLQDRYLHYAMWQLYKIVGSLELVGNPIGLLSSLGSGVRDFFYEPAHAIITSPTELRKIGRGVVKGAVSLVSNTTVGFLGTGITITRSIGRGVAKLSMDSAYMRRREELQRVPATLKAAAKRPLQDVSNGFYYAIVGVVKVPVKSYRRRGLLGLAPGIAKGVVGLATNPVVGILDAVAHSGDACRDMLNMAIKESAEPVQRLRLSDLFGPDGRILPYSYANALGSQILHVLDRSSEERVKMSNAINSGVGLIKTARAMLSRPGDAVSMSVGGSKGPSNRFTLLGDKRSRELSGDQGVFSASGKSNMVQRRNRFSFIASTEEESANVLRSDMGMFAHTMQGGEEADLDAIEAKETSKVPVAQEYVIYTAIIKQAFDLDLVAILTTERLIVTEYHRRPHSAYLKEQWVSPLSQLLVPVFERSGGKATLLLRSNSASVSMAITEAKKANQSARAGRRSLGGGTHIGDTGIDASVSGSVLESPNADHAFHNAGTSAGRKLSYLLIANYNEEDVIINLHNCLHSVLGFFDNLMSTSIPEHNDCEEKETGVVHIGAWQFARDTTETNVYGQSIDEQMDMRAQETQMIIKELEQEVWVHTGQPHGNTASPTRSPFATITPHGSLSAPYWLTAEQESAVNSHANIRNIFEMCNKLHEEYKKQPKSKVLLKISIQELCKGSIDFDTFLRNTQSMAGAAVSKAVVNQGEDDDSTGTGSSSHTGKKSNRSRFSLFPFMLGNSTSTGGGPNDPTSVAGVDANGANTPSLPKRSAIISFNLPLGRSSRASDDTSPPPAGGGSSAAGSVASASTPEPQEEDGGMGRMVSNMSSRLTASAMNFGAAALSLPSTLASTIAHTGRGLNGSPLPTDDTTPNHHSAAFDALNESTSGEFSVDRQRSSTHVPFNLSPMNTVSTGSGSWDDDSPAAPRRSLRFFSGKVNNKDDSIAETTFVREKSMTVSDFVPTIVESKVEPDVSFTYADLKPNKRRASPRLERKNNVRWSTGSISAISEDLETIEEENTNDFPTQKEDRYSSNSSDANDHFSSRSVGTVPSGDDTDDDALFFDALSPGELSSEKVRRQADGFGEFSEFAEDGMESISFTPTLLGGFHPVDEDSPPHSEENQKAKQVIMNARQPHHVVQYKNGVDEEHAGADGCPDVLAADSDEVESNGSNTSHTSQTDIEGVNPMYVPNVRVSPGVATFLSSSNSQSVHPLFNRANSFGRSKSFNDSDRRHSTGSRFVSPNSSGQSSLSRIFSDEFVRTRGGSRRNSSVEEGAASPEISAVVDRLDRLESLLTRALGNSSSAQMNNVVDNVDTLSMQPAPVPLSAPAPVSTLTSDSALHKIYNEDRDNSTPIEQMEDMVLDAGDHIARRLSNFNSSMAQFISPFMNNADEHANATFAENSAASDGGAEVVTWPEHEQPGFGDDGANPQREVDLEAWEDAFVQNVPSEPNDCAASNIEGDKRDKPAQMIPSPVAPAQPTYPTVQTQSISPRSSKNIFTRENSLHEFEHANPFQKLVTSFGGVAESHPSRIGNVDDNFDEVNSFNSSSEDADNGLSKRSNSPSDRAVTVQETWLNDDEHNVDHHMNDNFEKDNDSVLEISSESAQEQRSSPEQDRVLETNTVIAKEPEQDRQTLNFDDDDESDDGNNEDDDDDVGHELSFPLEKLSNIKRSTPNTPTHSSEAITKQSHNTNELSEEMSYDSEGAESVHTDPPYSNLLESDEVCEGDLLPSDLSPIQHRPSGDNGDEDGNETRDDDKEHSPVYSNGSTHKAKTEGEMEWENEKGSSVALRGRRGSGGSELRKLREDESLESPTVADLIDHFSSPSLTRRSSDRESRRLSQRTDH